MHGNSMFIFEKYAKQYFRPNMKILEIGPDQFPSTYQRMVGDSSITWETLNICQNDSLTYSVVDEYKYPIPDNYYDIVLSAQVLEHVRKIWIWVKELARICKKGGYVIIIAPLSWPYHEHPVDCWRVFPEGIKALYEYAELKTILAVCESIEDSNVGGYEPHVIVSLPFMRRLRRRIGYLLNRKLTFPIKFVFDTIGIGLKE